MTRTPIAAPRTEGRTFDTDWSIANVAKLLRSNANRGAWRQSAQTGRGTEAVNQNYLRTVSARHLPSGVSVIFMRLEQENCWYASLCFAGTDDGYLPWNQETAEVWLCALFGEDRPQVKSTGGTSGDARQFILSMKE
jgi:hypothetical protein